MNARKKTPITYYGGKQTLCATIINMMPAHKIYCEPFFGGGAVFWSKGKSYLEVINDKNDRLITFYRAVKDDILFVELYEKVQATLDSESLWRKAKYIYDNYDPSKHSKTDIAWAVWVTTNMSYASTPSGGWKWCNGTSGSHSGRTFRNYREQFTTKIHSRLEEVQISCRDALDVIRERDTFDTFFYLDPPYPNAEQKHYHGYKFADMEELLRLLSTIKGKFILSNYKSSLLKEYIEKNKWSYLVKKMALKTTNFHNHKAFNSQRMKEEVLVYNYNLEPKLF